MSLIRVCYVHVNMINEVIGGKLTGYLAAYYTLFVHPLKGMNYTFVRENVASTQADDRGFYDGCV